MNLSGRRDPHWAWTRIKNKYLRKSNNIELTCYPAYFDVSDTTVKFCHPEYLRSSLIKDLGRYLPYMGYEKAEIVDFVFDKEKYLNYFYDYDNWDFFLFEFQEPDKSQHEDGDGPYTQELYRRLDAVLGKFIARLPKNVTLFIASDHGFKPYRYRISLNAWFEKLGLLRRDPSGEIDTNKSFVFHFQWNIYVNKELLEREYSKIPGLKVPNGDSVYDAFLNYLIERGASFKMPGTGRPIPINFKRYPRSCVQPSPDLVVQGGCWDYRIFMKDKLGERTDLLAELEERKDVWYHRLDGIFIAYGKGIKKGLKLDTRSITDVAPTMLYALGLPCASYFDGKVMHEIFKTRFGRKRPVEIYAYYKDLEEFQKGTIATERADLEDKLRSLGYLE